MFNKLSITNNFVSKIILSYYNGDDGHQADEKTGDLGFGFIHYSILRVLKPKNILCIGSRKGFIPAICALACKDNKFGSIDFVDAGYDRDDKNHWSGIGWWKKIDPNKHFSLFGLQKHIYTYIMTSKQYAKKFPNKNFQYIYIDGDHSYAGVKTDYSLFWPKLDTYGFMVFHDVHVKYTKDLGHFGVWKLWKNLKTSNKIIFPFPDDSGLGILQKISSK